MTTRDETPAPAYYHEHDHSHAPTYVTDEKGNRIKHPLHTRVPTHAMRVRSHHHGHAHPLPVPDSDPDTDGVHEHLADATHDATVHALIEKHVNPA